MVGSSSQQRQLITYHVEYPPPDTLLDGESKACCSSSGLPRRFTTPSALTGINVATERSRLFPFEGRAGMWCSPVPAPSTDTRADPASARRAAGPARGRVGRAGGPLWCGPSLGAWGLFRPERLPDLSPRSVGCSQFVVTTDHERVCYCAPPARLLHRRPPPKGRASRAARAAE